MRNILFRADGNNVIGLGHVMRSLALISMLRENYSCHFAIQDPAKILKEIIIENCNNIIELPKSNIPKAEELIHHLDNIDIVVLDGYQFDDEYRIAIKNRGCKLVYIDDLHLSHISADVIINHAAGISAQQYDTDPFTQLCLGTQFALLRREFLVIAQQNRQIETIDTAFICFGGVDKYNLTKKSLEAILLIDEIKRINIVVGSGYHYLDELNHFVASNGSKVIELHFNVDAHEMINIMLDSQLAIIPASSICLEVMSIGMGLLLGTYVENQRLILEGCVKLNCCSSVGSFQELSNDSLTKQIDTYIKSEQWKTHIANQKINVTGNSSIKLNKVFNDLIVESEISIRKANLDDILTYFYWANDPDVRQNAINTDPILLEHHKEWFIKNINRKSSFLYYFENNHNPLGQVRFDLVNGDYLIDYSIDKQFRKNGLGAVILRMAMKQLVSEHHATIRITALVKDTNYSSLKTFEKLGFISIGSTIMDESLYTQFLKVI
ncbi:MAG: UDP-2,4-diacetamido-2,4,6-trideoxy-beta-L-altropyranose hydrolase [Bacteroidota bacterium]